MKKITLLLLLFMATTIATAQQFYAEGGKSSTSFDYKNSQGQSLSNLQATTQSFMGIGFRDQFFKKNLNFSAGLHYAGYGAIGSDDVVGNFMEWEANYAGLNVGLDYDLLKFKKASVYVKGAVSAALFVQGTQTLNHNVINLKNNDDFDTTLVTMQLGAGFSHPISDKLSFYAQYLYGKSTDTAKGDAVLKFKSNTISFGLLIDISNKQVTQNQ